MRRTSSKSIPLLLPVMVCLGGCTTPEPRVELAHAELLPAGETGKPGMVVDIDDTLVGGGFFNSLRLFLGLGSSHTLPFDGAVTAIEELALVYDIALVTARDDSFRERTIEWLATQGFPRLPIVFSTRYLPCDRCKASYKIDAIDALRRRGLRPVIGIGDKASDLVAYSHHDLDRILILDGLEDPDGVTTQRVLGGPHEPGSGYRIFAEPATAWPAISRSILSSRTNNGADGHRSPPPTHSGDRSP